MDAPVQSRKRIRKWARPSLATVAASALIAAPFGGALAAESTDEAEAHGQVLTSSLLSAIELVDLGYSEHGYPSDESTQSATGTLNAGVLEIIDLDLGGVSVPLISDGTNGGLLYLGELGALSSFSQANSSTVSAASAGVLGEGGALDVTPEAGVGENPAHIDLVSLAQQLGIDGLTDAVLDEARVEIGALGSTASSDNGTIESSYGIAGVELNLHSALIENLAATLDTTVTTATQTLDDTVSESGAVATILTGVGDTLNAIPLISVTSGPTIAINGVDEVGNKVSDFLIANPVLSNAVEADAEAGIEAKPATILVDLGAGTISVDLLGFVANDLGLSVNELPANTDLLTAEVVNGILAEVDVLFDELTTQLGAVVIDALNDLEVVIDAQVALADNPVTGPAATGGLTATGTLGALTGVEGETFTVETTLELLGMIDLGALINPVAKYLVDTLAGTTGGLVADVVDGAVDSVVSSLTGAVSDVLTTLNPLLTEVVGGIANIRLNSQPVLPADVVEGEFFTVSALSIDVLRGDLASIDIATSQVRALAEQPADVVIESPTEGAELEEGIVTVSGTAEPNSDITVNLGEVVVTTTASDTGDWSVEFTDVVAGTYNAVATDGVRDDSVNFTVAAAVVAPVVISSPVDGAVLAEGAVSVSGSAEPGVDVTVTLAEGVTASVTADEAGLWSVEFVDVVAGAYSVVATDGVTEDSVAFTVEAAAAADSTADADANVNASASASASATADDDSNASAQVAAQAAANADATSTASAAADVDATAAAASAANADASADASGAVEADASVSATASAQAAAYSDADSDATAEASAGADANAGAAASVAANADSSSTASAEAAATADADSTADADANVNASASASASATADDDSNASAQVAAQAAANADATSTASAAADVDATAAAASAANADASTAASADIDADATSAATAAAQAAAHSDSDSDAAADSTAAATADASAAASAAANADASQDASADAAADPAGETAPVEIVEPAEGDSLEEGTVTVSGTAEPGAEITVTLEEGVEVTTTADDEGNWTVVFEDVPAGDYTVIATDGVTEDSVTFSVTLAAVETDAAADNDATADSEASAADSASASASNEADASANQSGSTSADGSGNGLAQTGADMPIIVMVIAGMLMLAGATTAVVAKRGGVMRRNG